jgi:hypothetical protein
MNHQTAPILHYLQNQNNPTGTSSLGDFFYMQNGSVQPSDNSLYTCYKCGRDFPEFEPLQQHITNCTHSTHDDVLLLKDHDGQVSFVDSNVCTFVFKVSVPTQHKFSP